MRLPRNNQGQGLVEYVLVLAVVVGLVMYLYNHFRAPVQAKIDTVVQGVSNPQ